jgi:hypothetical protein
VLCCDSVSYWIEFLVSLLQGYTIEEPFSKFFGLEFFRDPLLKLLKNNVLQNVILQVFQLADSQRVTMIYVILV